MSSLTYYDIVLIIVLCSVLVMVGMGYRELTRKPKEK